MSQSIKIHCSLLLTFIGLGVFVSSVQAAILNVDGGGNLLGASNVDIGGVLYNVEFVDDSCINVFDGCDEEIDFDFSSLAEAAEAKTKHSNSELLAMRLAPCKPVKAVSPMA